MQRTDVNASWHSGDTSSLHAQRPPAAAGTSPAAPVQRHVDLLEQLLVGVPSCQRGRKGRDQGEEVPQVLEHQRHAGRAAGGEQLQQPPHKRVAQLQGGGRARPEGASVFAFGRAAQPANPAAGAGRATSTSKQARACLAPATRPLPRREACPAHLRRAAPLGVEVQVDYELGQQHRALQPQLLPQPLLRLLLGPPRVEQLL